MSYWDPSLNSTHIFVKEDLYYALITYNKDESIYMGQISNENFKQHGNGVLVMANGDYYLGEFENGKKIGNGKQKSDDKFYEGEFKDNLLNGSGVIHRISKHSEEILYEGEL